MDQSRKYETVSIVPVDEFDAMREAQQQLAQQQPPKHVEVSVLNIRVGGIAEPGNLMDGMRLESIKRTVVEPGQIVVKIGSEAIRNNSLLRGTAKEIIQSRKDNSRMSAKKLGRVSMPSVVRPRDARPNVAPRPAAPQIRELPDRLPAHGGWNR